MCFGNFLQIKKHFWRFFELHVLGSTFNLKIKFKVVKKTVLNSIKTLKRYLTATLSVLKKLSKQKTFSKQ